MATLKKTTEAQAPLIAQFSFTMADAMVNTSGVLTNFKATSGTVYDIFTLPFGSQVVGGDVVVKVVSNDTGAATISVGDSGSATRYLGATSIKALARTALVPTGFKTSSQGLRITLSNATGDATTGEVKVTVMFTVDGRAHENLKTT